MARLVRTKKKEAALKVEAGALAGGQFTGEQISTLEAEFKEPISIADSQALERRVKLQTLIPAARKISGRRRLLRLKGQRSTRRARITPDLFASSLGEQKQLLGA